MASVRVASVQVASVQVASVQVASMQVANMTTFEAISGGKVFTPDLMFDDGVVLICGGVIQAVGTPKDVSIPAGAEIIDASGKLVVPGFVDVHIHGLLGFDAMGPSLADVIMLLPAYGVTSFMATTLTCPRNEILASLREMADVLADPPRGARCLGIHLEGPYLSPLRPGMATREWLHPLTWDEYQAFQEAAGGHIRMITFAPEEGDAIGLIPKLIEAGVIPAIGHSNATFQQAAKAVELGLDHATHVFNAMRPFHHREPGVLGAVMHSDQMFAELIADGVHVHPAAMDILLRIKGVDRVLLISDAAPFAGLPDGEYEWKHETVLVKEGGCRLLDGTIAGAHVLMDAGVRNLVQKVGLPLDRALIPATRTAAASVGLKAKGRIAPGYDADIVLLDTEMYPFMTFVEGRDAWRVERGGGAWRVEREA
ncbi:MAG: N-acetylglucosamine-6-phosphate deacetylase [Chloroflexi bacterium]|nr:N-acetylglucosamine-6-phosphate deacetylase [Chloroflexota bacterium]